MNKDLFITATNTIALIILALSFFLGRTDLNPSGIPVILFFLSIGLCLTGAGLTIAYWKKIGIVAKVYGILPLVFLLIVIAIFFYDVGNSNMD